MEFNYGKEFDRELKKLIKKYPSLEEDLDIFLGTLELDPCGESILSNHIERISGLGENKDYKFYKVRKFVCKSISGNSSNSGIRIIYCYQTKKESISLEKIEFIEIYHKNIKENHDIKRIKNNYF